MENEVQNVTPVGEEQQKVVKGRGFFIAGIVFAVIAAISLVILYNFGAYIFGGADDLGEAIGAVFLVIIFLPIFLGVAGLSSLLSSVFSLVAFLKHKRSIPRIVLFVLALGELIAFVAFFFINLTGK